ncbi:MAG TPA: phage portal protein, partial [Tepidisphaeraceae bacterium]|nr:phage portal protein [Tepidisphaeraceae bacterium]
ETMVDYLFGKPIVIRSAAPDKKRRELLGALARAIVARNGGILFLQQLALMGAVYGFVDVLVKVEQCAGEVGKQMPAEGTLEAGACGTQDLGQPPATGEHGQTRTLAHATPEGGGGSVGGGEGEGSATAAGSALVAGETSPAARTDGEDSPAADDQAEKGAGYNSLEALVGRLARMIRLEIVEPARALPILSCDDYRVVEAYGQCYRMEKSEPSSRRTDAAAKGRWWERIWRSVSADRARESENSVLMSEIISATRWQRYENEVLVAEGENSLGEIPLVHIQNTALPFEYAGASDVEGLIPLQDELNTRLSDRASRITMQSFKMDLGKGIDDFTQLPVGPGRMWTSDNPDADVVTFGGDSENPAEALHIADLRETLDKTSGVSPIAAGAIKNRIGRLTSAAALRLTLISLLAKTEKKRTTYGMGLQRMIELALAWLDKAGLFATTPQERAVELHWPSPLPENEVEKLQEGEIKTRLGVPKEVVLRELGY